MEDQLRKGQPNSTEEIEVGKNTKYKTGKPGVNVLKEGKLRKYQSNSNQEVKGGEKQR